MRSQLTVAAVLAVLSLGAGGVSAATTTTYTQSPLDFVTLSYTFAKDTQLTFDILAGEAYVALLDDGAAFYVTPIGTVSTSSTPAVSHSFDAGSLFSTVINTLTLNYFMNSIFGQTSEDLTVNVTITEISPNTPVVPLPATFPLLAAALFGAGVATRRRRAR